MISVRVYGAGSAGGVKEVDPAEISDQIEAPGCLVWVDVADASDADLDCLQGEFSLHPLAMEDVRHRHQRPKLEEYPSHSFVVAYTSALQEVDLFVGTRWVVSVREADDQNPAWPIDGARARFDRTRADHVSPGFLLYVLLDELVDGWFDATDASEDALEDLEDRIFGELQGDERIIQQELFEARRRLVLFRRAVVPLREVVGTLMRREVEWIDQATATHLQDVYDHVLRAVDHLDAQRELLGNAVDAHLAIISNQMNAVMKRMTSWGAILLGSTLVAGIYGMNFETMPELKWRLGYAWALGIMLTITVVGWMFFRKKDWL
jgi:magnesium transporter